MILWGWRGLSGLCWDWRNGRGPHHEGRQEPQAPSPFQTPTAGSLQSWDEEPGPVLSEEGNSACLSSCSGGLQPLVELCVAPAGVSGRCTGVTVSLRVVPSPTGLPSSLWGLKCNGCKDISTKPYKLLLLLSRFSRVQLLATPWTAAYQAPSSQLCRDPAVGVRNAEEA